jgi:hypothetical protein
MTPCSLRTTGEARQQVRCTPGSPCATRGSSRRRTCPGCAAPRAAPWAGRPATQFNRDFSVRFHKVMVLEIQYRFQVDPQNSQGGLNRVSIGSSNVNRDFTCAAAANEHAHGGSACETIPGGSLDKLGDSQDGKPAAMKTSPGARKGACLGLRTSRICGVGVTRSAARSRCSSSVGTEASCVLSALTCQRHIRFMVSMAAFAGRC